MGTSKNLLFAGVPRETLRQRPGANFWMPLNPQQKLGPCLPDAGEGVFGVFRSCLIQQRSANCLVAARLWDLNHATPHHTTPPHPTTPRHHAMADARQCRLILVDAARCKTVYPTFLRPSNAPMDRTAGRWDAPVSMVAAAVSSIDMTFLVGSYGLLKSKCG